MNIQQRIQQELPRNPRRGALEPLFLAMLMVWTVGVTVSLL